MIRSCEKKHIPDEIEFQTKQQIAIDLIDRALAHGIQVTAWTFDELYGRDSKFLDALDARKQAFIAEIPCDTRGWTSKPKTIRVPATGKKGSKSVRRRPRCCEVRNLVTYSSVFTSQSWQRYRIKDTTRGPEVWEVKWAPLWRKTQDKLPSRKHTFMVARNVRTGEVKYFLSNQVVGVAGVTLRWLLRVAFGRWNIEACFRVAKEELGLDHFEVRGWRCIHRHYHLTALSYLFCNCVRMKLDKTGELTLEQVRRSVNVYLAHIFRREPEEDLKRELVIQQYYQRRNAQAKKSHTKTRIEKYHELGIDVERIKSCIP